MKSKFYYYSYSMGYFELHNCYNPISNNIIIDPREGESKYWLSSARIVRKITNKEGRYHVTALKTNYEGTAHEI